MKCSVLIILLLLIQSGAAQTKPLPPNQLPLNEKRYSDSLEQLMIAGKTDSIKANAIYLLADFWRRKDIARAGSYLEQAKKISGNSTFQQGKYYVFLADLTAMGGDIPQSEIFYLKADSLLREFSTKEANQYKSKLWHNYGVQQQRKDDQEAFADILLNKAIPYAKLSGDSVYLGKNYFDLGLAFKNLEQYNKSKEYCLLAIETLKKANAPYDQLVAVYNIAGEVCCLLGEYKEARRLLDEAKPILAPYPESPYWLTHYASEGMYYTLQKKFEESHVHIDKGVELAEKLGLAYNKQALLLQKFYASFGQKNFNKAKEIMAYLLAQPEMNALVTNRLQLYAGMSEAYAGLGQTGPAYEWLKKYQKLADSTHKENLKGVINKLETKFRSAENEKKIATLQAEKDRAFLSAKNSRLLNYLFGGATIFLLAVSALGWLYYRNNKKLAVQKELNYQQQLKEAEREKQMQYAKALLQGEETERKRIAGDLHDGLGGMLAGVKINLSKLADNADNNESMNANLYKVIDQLDNSVTELRRIARKMMPESLIQLGLEASLRDMCESLTTAKTSVEFQAFSISRELNRDIQVTVFRVVQELLANAIRHANASQIIVQCSQNENIFYISVEDNGTGFDQNILTVSKGIGINNVKNRVDLLKGKMDIASTTGNGTSVNIEFNVSHA